MKFGPFVEKCCEVLCALVSSVQLKLRRRPDLICIQGDWECIKCKLHFPCACLCILSFLNLPFFGVSIPRVKSWSRITAACDHHLQAAASQTVVTVTKAYFSGQHPVFGSL